jgi:hypothetical protein
MILEELSEHIGLHFQLPESYCSNVLRFPFSSPYASSFADDDDGSRTPFAHQSAKSIHVHARITYRFFLIYLFSFIASSFLLVTFLFFFFGNWRRWNRSQDMTIILGIFIFILCKPNITVYPAGFGRFFFFFKWLRLFYYARRLFF